MAIGLKPFNADRQMNSIMIRNKFIKYFKIYSRGIFIGERTINSAFNYATHYRDMSEHRAAEILATQLIGNGWFIPYNEYIILPKSKI